MTTTTILIDGAPFIVSEALARAVQDLLLTNSRGGAAALAVNHDQVRYAHWLDTEATYVAVSEAWLAIDQAQAPIPPRVASIWDRNDVPF